MLYKILFIILLLILLFVIYFSLLENYLLIEKDFLNHNDMIELSKILDYQNNIFLEDDIKKYILFDKDNNTKIYNIIYNNEKLKKIIKENFHVDLKKPSYDIEYRIYKNNKNSMGWHQDYKIVNKNYLECVYVIKNTTNSFFRWYKDFKFNEYFQKKNDLIILKPYDLIHNIDPILNGEKKILKFIINLD